MEFAVRDGDVSILEVVAVYHRSCEEGCETGSVVVEIHIVYSCRLGKDVECADISVIGIITGHLAVFDRHVFGVVHINSRLFPICRRDLMTAQVDGESHALVVDHRVLGGVLKECYRIFILRIVYRLLKAGVLRIPDTCNSICRCAFFRKNNRRRHKSKDAYQCCDHSCHEQRLESFAFFCLCAQYNDAAHFFAPPQVSF